jgi:hypothetical protein
MTAKIADAQITGAKIANATIGNAQIGSLAVGTAQIQTGAITNALIGTAAVKTTQIADGSITDAKIVGLTANKITAGKIDAANIEVVNLKAANITVGTINGTQIAGSTITANNIKNGEIGSNELATDINSTINTAYSNASMALTNASNAQSTANGKNKAYRQAAAPTSNLVAGDLWFDTGNANRVSRWNGSSWDLNQFGDAAISNLDAGTITTGTLSADRIGAYTITAGKILIGDFTNLVEISDLDNSLIRSSYPLGGVFTYSTDYAYAGAYSIKLLNPSGYATTNVTSGYIRVNPGDVLSFDWWGLNHNANYPVSLNIGLLKSDYSNLTYDFRPTTAPSNATADTWIEYSGQVTVPPNAYFAIIQLKCNANGGTGAYYFDNLIIRKTTGAVFIQDGAITASKITANTITGDKIAANTITSSNIQANTITASDIAANTITSSQIASRTITADRIVADSITAGEIASRTITANEIVTGTITSSEIKGNTIIAGNIATGTITADRLVAGTITAASGVIASATITGALIANATITSTQIASATITSANIANATIKTANIAALQITDALIANGTITSASIASATIKTANIAALQITDALIANGTITNASIASGTIKDANIQNGTILNASIADATIQYGKIGSVDASKITVGTLSADRIGAMSITTDKILIGDFTNYFPNPSMNTNMGGFGLGAVRADSHAGTPFVLSLVKRDNVANDGLNQIPLRPGDQFTIEADVYRYQNDRGQLVAGFQLLKNGTTTSTPTWWNIANPTPNSTYQVWTHCVWNVTIGTGGVTGSDDVTGGWIYFQMNQTDTDTNKMITLISNLTVKKKVGNTLIQDGSITTSKIVANAITANEIATNTITVSSGVIATGAITDAMIANASITNASIKTGTITDALIANGTITNASIKDSTITNTEIANATIQYGKIASVDASKITVGTLSADRIGANTITVDKLLIGDMVNYAAWANKGNSASCPFNGMTIDTSNYYSATASYKLSIGQSGYLKNQIPVMNGDIFLVDFWAKKDSSWNGTANNSKVRVGDQDGNLIGAIPFNTAGTGWTHFSGTVSISTGDKSITVSVNNDATAGNVWIDDIAIAKQNDATMIADGSITTSKIVANAITADKIATDAVTANEIKTGTITATSGTIASIDAGKISTGTLDASKITVTNLNAGSITTGTLTGRTISGGTITGTTISGSTINSISGTSSLSISGASIMGKVSGVNAIGMDQRSLKFYDYNGTGTLTGVFYSSQSTADASKKGVTIGTTQNYISFGKEAADGSQTSTDFEINYGDNPSSITEKFVFFDKARFTNDLKVNAWLYAYNIASENGKVLMHSDIDVNTKSLYNVSDLTHPNGGMYYIKGQYVTSFAFPNDESYLNVADNNGHNYGISIYSSDITLKTNIADSSVNALETVKSMRFRQFIWKDSGKIQKLGVIAQELQQLEDSLVLKISQPDGSVRMQPDETVLIPYLGKAIQELSSKIDDLQQQITELQIKQAS